MSATCVWKWRKVQTQLSFFLLDWRECYYCALYYNNKFIIFTIVNIKDNIVLLSKKEEDNIVNIKTYKLISELFNFNNQIIIY